VRPRLRAAGVFVQAHVCVQSLGGKTLVPPVEVPGRGSFAWFADPDGSIIGLWKPKQ
jgi:predicted enzyme related to lactoylglutathione lyase